MFKIKAIYLLMLTPGVLLAMNEESLLIDARAHLGNKKAAITRVYEEITNPYQASNAQNYLQHKLDKAVERAENAHNSDLSLGVTTAVVASVLLVPTLWPKQYPEVRFFSGSLSSLAYLFSGFSFFDWYNYKKPTITDIHNKIRAKLNRSYDGKKILAKKMGVPRWYSQPQAAQNPHNK